MFENTCVYYKMIWLVPTPESLWIVRNMSCRDFLCSIIVILLLKEICNSLLISCLLRWTSNRHAIVLYFFCGCWLIWSLSMCVFILTISVIEIYNKREPLLGKLWKALPTCKKWKQNSVIGEETIIRTNFLHECKLQVVGVF